MSERKVLTKYYPPDFDPSLITRKPKHLRKTGLKLQTVRLMAPFSMKCTHCGEYIYRGRKFNARKETTEERYMNIPIYRFYIRCTRCSSEITFRTDPKNTDYEAERGAKRNWEPWRDAKKDELEETDSQTLDRLEREEGERAEEEERDKMAELEEKTMEAKKEMAVADALDEIRMRNARIERGEVGTVEQRALEKSHQEKQAMMRTEEEEIERMAREAFKNKRNDESEEGVEAEEEGKKEGKKDEQEKNINSSSLPVVTEEDALDGEISATDLKTAPAPDHSTSSSVPDMAPKAVSMPPPSFAKSKRKKAPFDGGLGIKKKKASLV